MGKKDVLVLNKYWQPIYVVTLEEAVCILFQGRGKIVLDDFGLLDFEDWMEHSETILGMKSYDVITTARKRLVLPSIIYMHKNGYQPRWKVSLTRQNVYARDGGRCQYCGKNLKRTESTYDHVLPRSRGGKTTWENIVLCCKKCNAKKGDKTPEEAGMRLLKEPRMPKRFEMLARKRPEWKRFLDQAV